MPREVERTFSLDDYLAGRLEKALDAACGLANQPTLVVGYCMGRLLTLALAQRRPAQVGGTDPHGYTVGLPRSEQ